MTASLASASGLTYAAHGALEFIRQGNGTSGNGLFETWAYNGRLQPQPFD
jgi:hypothetical protein